MRALDVYSRHKDAASKRVASWISSTPRKKVISSALYKHRLHPKSIKTFHWMNIKGSVECLSQGPMIWLVAGCLSMSSSKLSTVDMIISLQRHVSTSLSLIYLLNNVPKIRDYIAYLLDLPCVK